MQCTLWSTSYSSPPPQVLSSQALSARVSPFGRQTLQDSSSPTSLHGIPSWLTGNSTLPSQLCKHRTCLLESFLSLCHQAAPASLKSLGKSHAPVLVIHRLPRTQVGVPMEFTWGDLVLLQKGEPSHNCPQRNIPKLSAQIHFLCMGQRRVGDHSGQSSSGNTLLGGLSLEDVVHCHLWVSAGVSE